MTKLEHMTKPLHTHNKTRISYVTWIMSAYRGNKGRQVVQMLQKCHQNTQKDICSEYVNLCVFVCASSVPSTDPEEFPALLDHVRQAMGGSQVLIQVPLIRLPQSLLSVHHSVSQMRQSKRT